MNTIPFFLRGETQASNETILATRRFLCGWFAVGLFLGTMDEAQSAHIYFSETGGGRIGRANLDGTGQTTIISGPNGGSPALDLAGGRMYWAVSGGGTIWRANLDGSGQEILVSGLSDPHAAVLDLAGGKMY